MPPAPRVSVVVIARNAARTLDAALDSAAAQTMGDFEVLLVLDASTDRTWDIARERCARDGRFRIVEGRGEGSGRARRLGIEQARSPLVAMLDADDLWEREKLATQMAFLEKHPELVLASSWGWYVGPSGRVVGRHTLGPTTPEENARDRAEGRIVTVLTSSAICRREAALAVDIPAHTVDAAEDSFLWTGMAARGPILTQPLRLASYRVLPDGVSASRLARQRMLVRWIEHNEKARLRGLPPAALDAFEERERRAGLLTRFRIARQNLGSSLYRRGGIHLAERHYLRGAALLFASVFAFPSQSFNKFRHQVLARKDAP